MPKRNKRCRVSLKRKGDPEKRIANARQVQQAKVNVPVQVSPLELAPPEVWDLIFGKLTNPEDLMACINSNNVFSNIMRFKKTNLYFEMLMPFLLPYMNKKDILAMSGVNHSWNSITDKCLVDTKDIYVPRTTKRSYSVDLSFANTQELGDYLDDVIASCAGRNWKSFHNAVVYRTVSLQFKQSVSDPNYSLFFKRLETFLAKFGNLINCFHLDVSWRYADGVRVIRLIQTCLHQMPNVRKASFLLSGSQQGFDEDAIDNYLNNNPLPYLQNLISLGACIPLEYVSRVLFTRYGHQLSQIEVQKASHVLRCDQLDLSQVQHFVAWISEQECVDKLVLLLQARQWDLIGLEIVREEVATEINYAALSQAINTFHRNLRSFRYSSTNYRQPSTVAGVADFEGLRLPKLRKLVFAEVGFPSLECLRRMSPNLEHLTIHYTRRCRFVDVVEGYIYGGLQREKDFWKTLAKVKTISVTNLQKSSRHEPYMLFYCRGNYENFRTNFYRELLAQNVAEAYDIVY